jgi:NADPH:quinone reductase-like Zn-dependent oxidoreductase
VRAFGADHIVDYTATTIAEAVKDPVDVVVNLVAGSREDTVWGVRSPHAPVNCSNDQHQR